MSENGLIGGPNSCFCISEPNDGGEPSSVTDQGQQWAKGTAMGPAVPSHRTHTGNNDCNISMIDTNKQ